MFSCVSHASQTTPVNRKFAEIWTETWAENKMLDKMKTTKSLHGTSGSSGQQGMTVLVITGENLSFFLLGGYSVQTSPHTTSAIITLCHT